MKAKDLMIGDWVKLSRGNWSKIVQVGLTDIEMIAESVYLAEPIPLTPEILEKKGLSKLVTYGTEKWVCDKFRLNEYDNKGVWRFCAYTNRNEDSVIYIRYVHELQHALKLCGIEKEVVL